MGVSGLTRTIPDVGYGITNALQDLAQAPIQAKRDPLQSDSTEFGTIWGNIIANAAAINGGMSGGQTLWYGIANYPLTVNSSAPTVANQAGLFSGTGAPTFNAPQGSLYLQVDGSSGTTRAFSAVDAVGTWTDIHTAL